MRKCVLDVKVIPGEEVALQHQLLVCDMLVEKGQEQKYKFKLRLKIWKLKDPDVYARFQDVFNSHCNQPEGQAVDTANSLWGRLKNNLLETKKEVCGVTKPHRWRKET